MNVSKRSLSRGFSLLELLVVVSILTVIAAASFVSLTDDEDQRRYDTTKERYADIREAMLGDEELLIINGAVLQKGYINDTGELPTELRALSVSGVNNVPAWGKLGSDLLAAETGTRFTDSIQGWINIDTGWRGPYFVRREETDEVLRDGWGNTFSFEAASIDASNNFVPMRLFSLGRGGEEDAASAQQDPSEIGYEEDYPFEISAKSINPREYQVATVPIPNTLQIRIETSKVASTAQRSRYILALLYPGMDLLDNFAGHEATLLDRNESFFSTLSDMVEDRVDGTDTIFLLRRQDAQGLFFNKPLARRCQIALIRTDAASSGSKSSSLAAKIVSVYPQVFNFIPGANPAPQIKESIIWDIAATGNDS